jgi:hypothetical protein
MATVRNFESISGQFNGIEIYTKLYYAHKLTTKVQNYRINLYFHE